MDSERFDELEERVQHIVETCLQLRQRTGELEEMVRRKDGELQEANRAIQALKDERETVKKRIDGLLERLEGLAVAQ